MCTLVEEYAKEYAEEVIAEKAVAVVDRMINELNLDISKACGIIGITVDKYQEYKKKNSPESSHL